MAEEDKFIDAFRTTLPVLIDKEMYKVRKQQRSLIMLVCLLLGVNILLFGAGLFLLLYNRQQPVVVQPVTSSVSTIPSQERTVTLSEPVVEEPIEEEPAEEPVIRRVERERVIPAPVKEKTPVKVKEPSRKNSKIPEYVLTHKGMTLQSLAATYYGHKLFWVCIYDFNSRMLKDPDVLPLGIRLHLPRPEAYGIDASDPSSLRRARALARSLTGEKGDW